VARRTSHPHLAWRTAAISLPHGEIACRVATMLFAKVPASSPRMPGTAVGLGREQRICRAFRTPGITQNPC
jgi:hypothetical protein